MDALVRTTLRQLILDHGRTLSADPKRCEAMLKDCCPAHRREIAALVVALRSRVASDLLAPPAGQPTGVLVNRLVQRVLDDHPMTEDAARWAVETWALALGVINAPLAPAPAAATAPAPMAPAPKPTPPPKAPAVHTPPKTTDPDPPDIHGWPAERVQALQRQAAAALGMPVAFRDPLRAPAKLPLGLIAGLLGRGETLTHGPEMVVIPAGSFLMGSPEGEEGRRNDEGPQHRVTIAKPFALGRHALTFDDYDPFCVATGRDKPEQYEGWGRRGQPVIFVTWDDAQAYCHWLSEQTGKAYRLPSEAEWEYGCRAGTITPFHFGAGISTAEANYNCGCYRSGAKGECRERTVKVGSLPPNPWGLHEVHGNVWEWCEDCWNDSYAGAPTDGSSRRHGDCARRLSRGGSWYEIGTAVRASARGRLDAGDRRNDLGLRLVRDL